MQNVANMLPSLLASELTETTQTNGEAPITKDEEIAGKTDDEAPITKRDEGIARRLRAEAVMIKEKEEQAQLPMAFSGDMH